jgi:hypothetical protein
MPQEVFNLVFHHDSKMEFVIFVSLKLLSKNLINAAYVRFGDYYFNIPCVATVFLLHYCELVCLK